MDKFELINKADELEEYASLMNDEVGEYWMALCNFAYHAADGSEDLHKAFCKELLDELKFAKDTYEIVEEERTVSGKFQVLKYKYE